MSQFIDVKNERPEQRPRFSHQKEWDVKNDLSGPYFDTSSNSRSVKLIQLVTNSIGSSESRWRDNDVINDRWKGKIYQ